MSDTTPATLSPEELEAIRQDFHRACYEAGPMRVLGPKGLALLAHAAALTRELEAARGALQRCLDAMDMQDKRETGEFHIPGETALGIWRDAQDEARAALSPPPSPPPGTESPANTRELGEAARWLIGQIGLTDSYAGTPSGAWENMAREAAGRMRKALAETGGTR